ncbi:MAG: class I SAM-dependent rRNA methyltransferase [Acidimicrobiales bacterium]|nr:class I SAM-dependent rRNA methyltransferase [Acidimicrobiales bacterium]
MAELPSPNDKRIAARLTADALRQVRGGHPWVFDRGIESLSHEGAPGDLAVVFDRNRKFTAIGLFDPRSPIRIRIVHEGKPRTIDADHWADRLAAATERRRPLLQRGDTSGYRLVHGENDGFGGLVVDRYDATLVAKLYSEAWLPHLADIVPLLAAQPDVDRVVLRVNRQLAQLATGQRLDRLTVVGDPPTEPVLFTELGLTFQADVLEGQKTGHFLDQRENRAAVAAQATGRRVLDVFSCTGGFAVHAAAAGAALVHVVDQSEPALATARVNFDLNIDRTGSTTWRATAGDAFEVMAGLIQAGDRYDIVVIDPPSFASRQDRIEAARASYRRLTRLGLDLLVPGGLLVQASCSSRVTAETFFADIDRELASHPVAVESIEQTGHAIDHPISFPEGAYLKAAFVRTAYPGPV